MYNIHYLLQPGGSPIDHSTSAAATLDGAKEDAELHIRDKLAGPSHGLAGIGFTIEDATGKYIGTWFNGKQIADA